MKKAVRIELTKQEQKDLAKGYTVITSYETPKGKTVWLNVSAKRNIMLTR